MWSTQPIRVICPRTEPQLNECPDGKFHADGEVAVIGTTPFQSVIASIHLYPFVVAVEKNVAPVSGLRSERHGTQWQPFL